MRVAIALSLAFTLTGCEATDHSGSAGAPPGAPVDVLPPDPGPTNDQTVAGIDSNSNGIRDDVERYIAFNYSSAAEVAALRQFARAFQGSTTVSDRQAAIETERRIFDAIACLHDVSPGTRAQALVDALGQEQANTEARIASRVRIGRLLAGYVMDLTLGGQGATCLSSVARAAALRPRSGASVGPGGPPGFTIVFINGIWTDQDGANASWLQLMDAVGWSHAGRPIRYKLAYNPSDGVLADIQECVNQKVAEFPGAGALALANVYYRLTVPWDLQLMFGDRLVNAVAQDLARVIKGRSSYTDAALDGIKAEIEAELGSGARVLLVPHSQGNFYANCAYEGIASAGGLAALSSMAIVGVASPAWYVPGGSSFVTSTNDLVINFVRLLDPMVPATDFTIDKPSPDQWISIAGERERGLGAALGHDLTQIYLNRNLQGRAKVVAEIRLALDRLAMVEPVSTVTVALGAPALQVGQATTATATLRDASGNVLSGRTVSWVSSDSAAVTVSPAGVVTALSTGSSTISATSEGATGSANVTVGAPIAPPVISSFTATPGSIAAGGTSTLAWNVTGATSLSIDQGIGVVTGTSRIISPIATTTYLLTATNSAGAAAAAATVIVTGGAGGLIAFQSNRSGTYQIYVMRPDGTGLARLTSNASNDTQPAWSPDGRKLAFASDRGGRYAIYTMDLDGSGVAQLTNSSGSDTQPTWSPDGSRIAFTSTRDGVEEIYSTGADGAGAMRLTSSWATHKGDPSWSPDGTQISYNSWQSGSSEIWVMSANGTHQARLTNCTTWSGSARWSPDGTRIGFSSYGYAWIMNSDGTGARNLTGSCQLCACPQTTQYDDFGSWSPDGMLVTLQSRRDGNSEIYVMGLDGTGFARVTSDPADDSRPSWTGASVFPQPPLVDSFTATPTAIVAGDISTLAWVVRGATSLSIDQGIGLVSGSSTTVRPAATTSYVLTASNAGGSTTRGLTVAVATATTDFTLALEPDPPSAIRSWSARVLTTQVGGPGVVSLAADVFPAGQGVTATLSATSVQAGGTAVLDVVAGGSAPAGRYVVTVIGAEGSTTHEAGMTIDVTP